MFGIGLNSVFVAFQTRQVTAPILRTNRLDVPFTEFTNDPTASLSRIPRDKPVFVVCRFGNDSQLVVETIKKMDAIFPDIKDIRGGLNEWAETFPTDIIPKY
jgi:rhodanese-related sulfurtransferase